MKNTLIVELESLEEKSALKIELLKIELSDAEKELAKVRERLCQLRGHILDNQKKEYDWSGHRETGYHVYTCSTCGQQIHEKEIKTKDTIANTRSCK